MRWLVALLSLMLCAAAPAAAQDDLPAGSVMVAGGLTMPLGAASDAMGAGWNVGVGGTARVAPGIGLRADYLYSRFASATETWNVDFGPFLPAFMEVPVRAKSQMHIGSLDVVWGRRVSPGARAYVMAGPSLFHRRVQITGNGPQGRVTACDPQWLQCPSAPLAFDRALGIKTSSDIGFNLGAGIAFRAGLTALLTIEARYFQVRGPSYQATDGRSASGTARFVPVSVGLSF